MGLWVVKAVNINNKLVDWQLFNRLKLFSNANQFKSLSSMISERFLIDSHL